MGWLAGARWVQQRPAGAARPHPAPASQYNQHQQAQQRPRQTGQMDQVQHITAHHGQADKTDGPPYPHPAVAPRLRPCQVGGTGLDQWQCAGPEKVRHRQADENPPEALPQSDKGKSQRRTQRGTDDNRPATPLAVGQPTPETGRGNTCQRGQGHQHGNLQGRERQRFQVQPPERPEQALKGEIGKIEQRKRSQRRGGNSGNSRWSRHQTTIRQATHHASQA